MVADLFNTRKQLVFYGAYHNNPTNIRIHMLFVPLIVWATEVLHTRAPVPAFIPHIHHAFNDCLVFELNLASAYAAANWLYYFSLEPVAALLYLPQYALMLLSAIAFSQKVSNAVAIAVAMQIISWGAQFLGHGLAEKRAPALVNNLVGAFVLAPFFVHLEILFGLGYRRDLYSDIQDGVAQEISKVKKAEEDKRRAKVGRDL